MGSGKLISLYRLRHAASSHGGRLWPGSDRQSCKPIIFDGYSLCVLSSRDYILLENVKGKNVDRGTNK